MTQKATGGAAEGVVDDRGSQSAGRVLLFVPAYNCEGQLPRVLAQLTPELQRLFDEVVVVDNRSTDKTLAAAEAA